MSGTTRTSSDLDPRRRRLLYRAWHRGMREMDLVLGRFCDAEIDRLTEAELAEIEELMELPDQELYGWITTPAATPPHRDTPLLARLRVSGTPGGAQP
jgi:antitoxin CptB